MTPISSEMLTEKLQQQRRLLDVQLGDSVMVQRALGFIQERIEHILSRPDLQGSEDMDQLCGEIDEVMKGLFGKSKPAELDQGVDARTLQSIRRKIKFSRTKTRERLEIKAGWRKTQQAEFIDHLNTVREKLNLARLPLVNVEDSLEEMSAAEIGALRSLIEDLGLDPALIKRLIETLNHSPYGPADDEEIESMSQYIGTCEENRKRPTIPYISIDVLRQPEAAWFRKILFNYMVKKYHPTYKEESAIGVWEGLEGEMEEVNKLEREQLDLLLEDDSEKELAIRQEHALRRRYLNAVIRFFTALEDAPPASRLSGDNEQPFLAAHQQIMSYDAVHWGGRLYDAGDTGTGKTRKSLDIAEKLRDQGKVKKVLVLSHASLQVTWIEALSDDFKEGQRPNVTVITNKARRDQELEEGQDAEYVAINIEKFRGEDGGKALRDWVREQRFDLVIIDEVAKIRSYKTKRQKKGEPQRLTDREIVYQIVQDIPFRILNSANPIENTEVDLAAGVQFLSVDSDVCKQHPEYIPDRLSAFEQFIKESVEGSSDRELIASIPQPTEKHPAPATDFHNIGSLVRAIQRGDPLVPLSLLPHLHRWRKEETLPVGAEIRRITHVCDPTPREAAAFRRIQSISTLDGMQKRQMLLRAGLHPHVMNVMMNTVEKVANELCELVTGYVGMTMLLTHFPLGTFPGVAKVLDDTKDEIEKRFESLQHMEAANIPETGQAKLAAVRRFREEAYRRGEEHVLITSPLFKKGVTRGSNSIFSALAAEHSRGGPAVFRLDGENSDHRVRNIDTVDCELTGTQKLIGECLSNPPSDLLAQMLTINHGINQLAQGGVATTIQNGTPWLQTDENQTEGRTWRTGQTRPVVWFIKVLMRGLEQFIDRRKRLKYERGERYLWGRPPTELDRKLFDEGKVGRSGTKDLLIFTKTERQLFGELTALMSGSGRDFIAQGYGPIFAELYNRNWETSYNGNTNRLVGAIITELIRRIEETGVRKENGEFWEVVDIACGTFGIARTLMDHPTIRTWCRDLEPEMVKEEYGRSILEDRYDPSLVEICPMDELPDPDGSRDFAISALALDCAKHAEKPRREGREMIRSLLELMRVLREPRNGNKIDTGYGLIALPRTIFGKKKRDIDRNRAQFRAALPYFGCEIVREFTGHARGIPPDDVDEQDEEFDVHLFTVGKVGVPAIDEDVSWDELPLEVRRGLSFPRERRPLTGKRRKKRKAAPTDGGGSSCTEFTIESGEDRDTTIEYKPSPRQAERSAKMRAKAKLMDECSDPVKEILRRYSTVEEIPFSAWMSLMLDDVLDGPPLILDEFMKALVQDTHLSVDERLYQVNTGQEKAQVRREHQEKGGDYLILWRTGKGGGEGTKYFLEDSENGK